MNEEDKKKVVEKLKAAWAIEMCGRCKHDRFIVDGYFQFPVVERVRQTALLDRAVPAVAAICERCGAITFHAARLLIPEVPD